MAFPSLFDGIGLTSIFSLIESWLCELVLEREKGLPAPTGKLITALKTREVNKIEARLCAHNVKPPFSVLIYHFSEARRHVLARPANSH
jgi:hypothetical protein